MELDSDTYFMSMAVLVSYRSPDPFTRVGSILCDSKERVIATGFNDFPQGHKGFPWSKDDKDPLKNKYLYVLHSEAMLLSYCTIPNLSDFALYTTLFPCSECAKLIASRGIKTVVYLSDKYHNTNSCTASRKIFDVLGVKYRQFKPEASEIVLRFEAD